MCRIAGTVGLVCLLLRPQVAPAQTSETDHLESIVSLKVVSDLALLTKEWCDLRLPEGSAAHEKALQSWQQEYRADEIAHLYARHTGQIDTAPATTGDALFPKFDAEYPDAKVVCDDLETYLFKSFDLRALSSVDYVQLLDEAKASEPKAPVAPEEEGTNAIADWGLIDADLAAERLSGIGAKLPLKLGGELQPGAYSCQQKRFYGESTRSDEDYTLMIYGDKTLRVNTTVAMLDGSMGKGAEYEGFYGYNPETAAFNVNERNHDSYDIGDYHFFNGVYDAVGDDPDLVAAFVAVTDADGKPFFYGFHEYGTPFNSVTVCSFETKEIGLSFLQVATVEQAEKDAERYKYRTDPGKGLRLDQIEGYLYTSSYHTTVGGGDPMTEDVDLLLKDGWVYGSPDYSPHDFNAEASKRGEPLNWYRWKRENGALQTSVDGENWVPTDGTVGLPLIPENVNGIYKKMVVYGDGIATEPVIKTRSWTFSGDGTFSYLSSSRAAGFYDTAEEKGTYTLDGYTLELTYDDGTVWRTFVLGWGDPGKNVLIGGETFSRE